MQITSSAFKEGQPIPIEFTDDGDDVSPPLTWTNVPAEAKELALIVDDPDAPRPEPWVHWVIYGIPASVTGLPQDVPHGPRVPTLPGVQGSNSFDRSSLGYRGPSPPPRHGMHHYRFTLYALDAPMNLQPGLTKDNLLNSLKGHILQQARLVGTYERKK